MTMTTDHPPRAQRLRPMGFLAKTVKMNANILLTASALACMALTSCIKEELPNAECDITGASLPAEILNGDPIIKNEAVEFHVMLGTDVTSLSPQFTLTPGATIMPPSGTTRDFTLPQTYTVTSEDGQWHKEYTVSVTDDYDNKLIYIYNFDNAELKETSRYSFDVFFEANEDGQKEWDWSSANAGFAMSGMGSTPETFPTSQGDNGRGGHCAVLQTLSTGSFGERVKKPIAAGNLYTGTFNTVSALANPLRATHFGEGRTFYRYPILFRGTYKYTAGETYYVLGDDGKLVADPTKEDECNIYAVLFSVDDSFRYLDGTNVLAADNEHIIATAEITAEQRRTTDGWITFNAPFKLRPGKDINPTVLASGGYNLAIVASSSMEGDYFNGALGSKLMIDMLELYCVDTKPDYQ